MADIIQINASRLKKIKVNEYGDCIGIDVNDATIQGKIASLVEYLNSLEIRSKDEIQRLSNKYDGRKIVDEDNNIDTEQIIDISRFHTNLVKEMIERIDNVFGKDCIHKVFRESYELIDDYIPDESAIMDFMEQILPIMRDLFNQKFELNKARYNAHRRGKYHE